jgi:pyruvate,water dikinase
MTSQAGEAAMTGVDGNREPAAPQLPRYPTVDVKGRRDGQGPVSSGLRRDFVVDLRSDSATHRELTGGKAAALARTMVAGLSVLPGTVLTTAFSDDIDAGTDMVGHWALREAFDRADGDHRSLVVRSSAVAEDAAGSSLAGQFDSVIGTQGFVAFVGAVRTVLDSRSRAGAAELPIAVLIQPMIEPSLGGVLFGADPITGRTDRRVVSAVRGGPQRLVAGELNGSRYVLDAEGKVLTFDANDGAELSRRDLRRLAALSSRVASVFGRPQDVEWAIAADGQLWLLQSRSITTEIRGVPTGPIYGPGPVAETFPEPLTELERDLWVPSLKEAVSAAVLLAGTVGRAELEETEVVVSVAGRLAIDLRLAGEVVSKATMWQRLNPLIALRHLCSAWRVGRLRAALPRLSENVLARVDADLEAVPALDELTSRQLIALLHRSHSSLRALHAHEILLGMLTDTGHNRMTGASVALRILDEARRDGQDSSDIIHRSPAVLALSAPRIAPAPVLPPEATAIHLGSDCENANDNGILREALRMRARWLQELTGRAAWRLGERLTASGDLTEPDLIRHMSLAHVEAVALKRAVVVPALVRDHRHDFADPLPARFQLSDLGKVIPVVSAGGTGGGTAAGGGIGRGRVTHDARDPAAGSVLVTTTLTPGLGPLLSRLEGIVAETGSVLSHLAILAREARVATVVGYTGAAESLPEGAIVSVNGETGEVTIEAEEVKA